MQDSESAHLLLIDDDVKFTRLLSGYLQRFGSVVRRAAIAQTNSEASVAPVSVGCLQMDPSVRTASFANRPLELTTGEYDLLLALARAHPRVKSREQLLLEVAERDLEAFDRS